MRLSLLFIFLSIFGFSQTETHQFPKVPSSISVPISLPISEVQRLTNQSITGTLYEDQSYENNDNDQLKTKVEKDGEIVMKALTRTTHYYFLFRLKSGQKKASERSVCILTKKPNSEW